MTDTRLESGRIDPERLSDDDGVDTERRTNTYADADEYEDDCGTGVAGRAIVGVTDAEGRLLVAVHESGEAMVLPNETVAHGEDWATVARERIEGMTGTEVELDGVAGVRRVDHVVEGEDAPWTTTHQVVFAAALADGAIVDGLCDANEWNLEWHAEVPVPDFDREHVLDDVRLFIE